MKMINMFSKFVKENEENDRFILLCILQFLHISVELLKLKAHKPQIIVHSYHDIFFF